MALKSLEEMDGKVVASARIDRHGSDETLVIVFTDGTTINIGSYGGRHLASDDEFSGLDVVGED